MSRILVITDTVSNIPDDIRNSLGIILVPLHIEIDGKSYRDAIDIAPDTIYQKMREWSTHPSTSQVNPHDYLSTFENNLKSDTEAILVITLSSKLSSTYISAVSAKQAFEEAHSQIRVEVIDSLCAAMSEGWIAIEAARTVNKGAKLDEALVRIKEISSKLKFYVVFETLEYLRRGGRIGRAAAFMGSALHILPIITFSPDGTIIGISRVRSKKKGYEWMINRIRESLKPGQMLHLAVMHADAKDEARWLLENIKAAFPCRECFITTLTPIMGIHTGPGLVGVSYFAE
ncbi:MAG: DegV family protein [Actinobacteria bacterium]|nr:DegV family protein [Actinomycetota bacterium]